ncbi:hypothetical protein PIB30_112731, partial [Stylosanthes scabra]|nr:hypothetical protein [Stylosanthes scabra]
GLARDYDVCNGVLYWLNFNNNPSTSPQCIVHYSPTKNEFGYILIPPEAVSLEQRLISINVVLCFVGIQTDGGSYSWTMWMIKCSDGSKSWQFLLKSAGTGPVYYPESSLLKEIVMLRQRISLHEGDGDVFMVRKEIKIAGLRPRILQAKVIQCFEFELDYYAKHVCALFDVVVPV